MLNKRKKKMKRIVYILLLSFSLNAVPIKEQHKKEINNWHNAYLNGKIGQEETSLLAQRMYYIFEGFNEVFKSKKLDKAKLLSIGNATNEINAKIKAIDKGHISKAIEQITARLNTFKLTKDDPQQTILDLFNYLQALYEKFYTSLKNKKITIGPDKGKILPDPTKLKLPNEKEIEKFLNKKTKQRTIILKAKK